MAKKAKVDYAWGQPVCPTCWGNMTVKIGRTANNEESEQCCHCNGSIVPGEAHMQRVNPGSVPYPSILKGED